MGLWLTLVVVIVGGGIAYKYKNTKKTLTKVKVEAVEKRSIMALVSESGNIQPNMEVPIAPDVSGEVVALHVREGQYVKKGQLLVVIRPDNYQAALEQTQASVNTAQANYMQVQATLNQSVASIAQDSANLQRLRKLNAEKIVADQEVENAALKLNLSRSQYEAGKYNVQAAYYQLKSAEASLKQAQQNLSRTNVYATMDGTVTKLNVEVGQRVVGTTQMAGTEMMKIADLSVMEVVANINENDIVKLNLGDSATIEVDAFKDVKLGGRVTDIAYSASKSGLGTTDQVTSFQVKVRINPQSFQNLGESKLEGGGTPKLALRPGMSAMVEIYTDKVSDVVAVPIQAVGLYREKEDILKAKNPAASEAQTDKTTEKKDKPKEVVFVCIKGKAKQVPVRLGIADDTYIEIKEGLSVGDSVITGPYTVLTKELYDELEVEKE